MKQGPLFSLRVAVLAILGVGSIPAMAQTTAKGPYYPTPAWDQTLACTALNDCPRFVVLSNMSSAAVLDRETGLVWEQSPSTSLFPWYSNSGDITAATHCNRLAVANRLGWRLPTVQELASLVDGDPANTSSPRLPPGHPFSNVLPANYWSASTITTCPNCTSAYVVHFGVGGVGSNGKNGFVNSFAWCVRGGQGMDVK